MCPGAKLFYTRIRALHKKSVHTLFTPGLTLNLIRDRLKEVYLSSHALNPKLETLNGQDIGWSDLQKFAEDMSY